MSLAPLEDGPWLDFLDETFVAATYLADQGAAVDREDVKRWFSTNALHRFCKLAEALDFDPAFYSDIRPEVEALSPAERFRYWLVEGLGFNDAGTARDYLRRLGLSLSSFPAAFHWLAYAEERPEAGANRWTALEDLVKFGFPNLGARFVRGPDSGVLFCALGIYYSGRDDALALQAYELARRHGPLPASEYQHMADAYLRLNAWRPALELYRLVLKTPAVNKWTVINGLRCARKLGTSQAIAQECFDPANAYAAEDRAAVGLECARAIFEAGRDDTYLLLTDRNYPEASALAKRCGGTLRTSISAFLGDRAIVRPSKDAGRMLLIVNADVPSRAARRVDGKVDSLRKLGLPFDVVGYQDLASIELPLELIKAVFLYQVPALPEVVLFLASARSHGCVLYFDTDDDVCGDLSLPGLDFYGGYLRDLEYSQLCFGNYLYAGTARFCDFGIAPTEALADRLGRIACRGKAFVMPDRVEAGAGFENHEDPANGKLLVSLFSDRFLLLDQTVNPASQFVLDLLHRREDIILYLEGPIKTGADFTKFFARIRYANTSGISPDIAISISDNSPLGEYHRLNAWTRAAQSAVPLVALLPSGRDAGLPDGADLAHAPSGAEWLTLMTVYLDDRERRRQLGDRARAKFLESFGPDHDLEAFVRILDGAA